MASVNKVILLGNLGADPEVRFTSAGEKVVSFRLATSETYKSKSAAEKQEITQWHRIVMFRKLADIASEYLKKGSQVYLEGRLRTRKWTDKSGQDQYTTEIEADQMQMLGGKSAISEKLPPNEPAKEPITGYSPGMDECDFPF